MSSRLPDERNVIPLEGGNEDSKSIRCPLCFSERHDANAPCPKCGFDERTGLTSTTVVGKKSLGKEGLTCTKCGYNMGGLPSLRCPECGTVVTPPSARDRYQEDSHQIAKETYRTPLLMIAIGGGLLCLSLLVLYGPADAMWNMLSYIIQVPIGVAIFLLCCLIWIGFDAPIHLTALRLAGIYMVVDFIGLLTGYIPVVGWLIPLFVYVGLLSEMLDIELTDAIAVALLTFFAKLFAAIWIFAMFGMG